MVEVARIELASTRALVIRLRAYSVLKSDNFQSGSEFLRAFHQPRNDCPAGTGLHTQISLTTFSVGDTVVLPFVYKVSEATPLSPEGLRRLSAYAA